MPASFESFDNPNVRPHFDPSKQPEADEVLETLEKGLDWLRSCATIEFGFAYAETGLPLHLSSKRMTVPGPHDSIDDYRETLLDLQRYADVVTNMEV